MTKKRKRRKTKNKSKIDITVISIFLLSIISAILIYMQTGAIGVFLSPILGGLVSFIKFILPIIIFILGIVLISKEKEYYLSKFIQFVFCIVCINTIMTILCFNDNQLMLESPFSNIIEEAYILGTKNIGGGVIGVFIAVPLVKLFGIGCSLVLAIGMCTILAIFTFGLSPIELVEKMTERQNIIREKKREIKDKKNMQQTNFDFEKDTPNNILSKTETTKDELKRLRKEEYIEMPKIKHEHIKEHEQIDENLFKETEEVKEEKTKQILQLAHTQVVQDENYEFPPITMLELGDNVRPKLEKKTISDNALKLQKTLYSFGVSAKVENVSVGPAITRYELKPAEGVRVSKIANLADDIALNLAAESIRIEAPIPGKQAVGIEIPNKENQIVHLRDVIDSEEFVTSKSKLAIGLGKDVSGTRMIADIAKMPHLLVAGSTGSGKSVCINTIITSIIYKSKPSEVKLVMVDPKIVELSVYNGIPHLLIPVVTDPRKAAGALAWAVQEMDNRYNLFASKGVRDIKGYNKALNEENMKLPQIVIIIDELADLMMVAAKDVEEAICRLAQKARAAGMHLVIATQRPSVDVITGLIKANIPSRIAFAVSSQVDSRTILDMAGAEKLLGKGDMLFYPTGTAKPVRVQGAYVSDKEVEDIVSFLKKDGEATYNSDIIESIEKANSTDKEKEMADNEDNTDPFLEDAIETVIESQTASASYIQRRFKVGYARAGRIIDQMEQRGIISGYQGSKPREVLMTKERWKELKMQVSPEEEVE